MVDPTVIGRRDREPGEREPGEREPRDHEPRDHEPRDREQRARPLLRTMLGDVLRRTRQEQGRTLADVARAARVSMPYLSELERGRKEASSEVLAAICDALHIGLSDLLAEVQRNLSAGRPSRADRIERAPVVPLDAVRGGRVTRPARGSGEATCLLAA